MKMYIYSNLNAMFQFQSMTYQKVFKPFVVYLYSFLVDVFVSLLISLLIYENDLNHNIYDDTTNYTIQINHMLNYSPKII
jgi:hypothetical protein